MPIEVEEDEVVDDVEGVEKKLTADGGVVKKILQLGEGWETPETGDEVSVHYVGTLTDGTKFDSSRDRDDPFKFNLGEGRVIKGWDIGVATMRKGERAILTCQPDYAYGAAGSPPTIPPNSTLNFEVELLSWKSAKDISGDGGVLKTTVKSSEGWDAPIPPLDEDEVVVTYSVRLASDSDSGPQKKAPESEPPPVLLSSPEGGVTFTVGEGHLCRGLVVAVKTMKPEEEAEVILSPEYAFGDEGCEGIPPGSTIVLHLTLKAVHKVEVLGPGLSLKTLEMAKPRKYSTPNQGSTVKLVGRGLLPDGTVFQEWSEGAELSFTTDEEEVPEGLEMAVNKMEVGQHCVVTISDPGLGYGAAGFEGAAAKVAPGSGVVFDVTMTDMVKAKETWGMNNDEKVKAALGCKDKGNAAYKAGKLPRAIAQYSMAVEFAKSVGSSPGTPLDNEGAASSSGSQAAQQSAAKEVRKSALLNLAAAYLKEKDWGEAIKSATQVLDVDSANIKALYRRAQAYLAQGDLLEAERDVKAGLLLEEDNTDLQAFYRKLKVHIKQRNKQESAMYGKMFKALRSGPTSTKAAAEATKQQLQQQNGDVSAAERKDQGAVDGGDALAGPETPAMNGTAVAAGEQMAVDAAA